ncbi:uncharacterized protein [Aegilops tauschii subsp. strangulata]|uniref:uncharacterized protein n=1 Tax=Aegilops tauschii subsp. strangulata TaxID=200361 RepID=UPI00098B94AF|nr:uncharacterized protein LOC109764913 [Aegilops tauschii subsp. strangulata]
MYRDAVAADATEAKDPAKESKKKRNSKDARKESGKRTSSEYVAPVEDLPESSNSKRSKAGAPAVKKMRKNFFDRLYHGIWSFDEYFILKKDAMGRIGFSSYQKCTAALRMLAYGTTVDLWDEYLRMSERTCEYAMVRFATVVVSVFGPQYLREPTVADTKRLLAISEARGWSGLLESLDYMHWKWKNCPKALQGEYQGHVKKPTIILEAVASQDLWIWHA